MQSRTLAAIAGGVAQTLSLRLRILLVVAERIPTVHGRLVGVEC